MRSCRAKLKRKNDAELAAQANKSARLDAEIGSGTENNSFMCRVCDDAFTVFEHYQAHMKTHPGEPVPVEQSISPPPTMTNVSPPLTGKNPMTPVLKSPAPVVKSPLIPGQSSVTAEELLNIEPEFDQSLGEFVFVLYLAVFVEDQRLIWKVEMLFF